MSNYDVLPYSELAFMVTCSKSLHDAWYMYLESRGDLR